MQLAFKKNKSALVVSLSGELDHHCARTAKEEIDRRFAASGLKNIVFDLSGLDFMDSSGIGIIIGRFKVCASLGGRTSIAAPPPHVARVLHISGMRKVMPIWGSVDAAVHGM